MPIEQDSYDLFISFATVDREVAERLHDLLEQRDLKTFFSPKELQGGDPWQERIRLALRASKELCLVVSKASLQREWVLTEWGGAWLTEKRITPILVDVGVTDLPLRLQQLQAIRLDQLEVFADQAADRLKKSSVGSSSNPETAAARVSEKDWRDVRYNFQQLLNKGLIASWLKDPDGNDRWQIQNSSAANRTEVQSWCAHAGAMLLRSPKVAASLIEQIRGKSEHTSTAGYRSSDISAQSSPPQRLKRAALLGRRKLE